LKQKINKFISTVTCFCFVVVTTLVPLKAYAEDSLEAAEVSEINLNVVTNLRLGQAAPFTGILLSEDAAAKLFADIKFSQRECNLKIESEVSLLSLKYKADLDALQLRLDIETDRSQKLIEVKNERIQFLESNYKPPAWYESGEFWMAIGVISGVLITVSAGYAINQASK